MGSARHVQGVGFDSQQRLWFASPQGVGVRSADRWSLFRGEDGLPYNDFTALAIGNDGTVWLGTTRGLIGFDGHRWRYRSAPRWLPDDQINDIAVAADGSVWIATPKGIGVLRGERMTLATKASQFETQIQKYHRRTPYGYVASVRLGSQAIGRNGPNTTPTTTACGPECTEPASVLRTPPPKTRRRRRAQQALEALRFLSQVTQGGSHPAPPGFPARSIRPTSQPDPNEWDSISRDQRRQERDPLWKIIAPRWPISADRQWYWKCDTSSDELDGHYFFYACYYDLVADTPPERQKVREVVIAMTDHLLAHNFELIDHDGQPTRWVVSAPRH